VIRRSPTLQLQATKAAMLKAAARLHQRLDPMVFISDGPLEYWIKLLRVAALLSIELVC
jgi:hypothetical protein